MLHAGSSASHTLNTAGAAAMGEEEGAHRELRGGGHARKLTAPLRGDVNTPPESPYSCAFRLGECTYDGPLVGIECSSECPDAAAYRRIAVRRCRLSAPHVLDNGCATSWVGPCKAAGYGCQKDRRHNALLPPRCPQ